MTQNPKTEKINEKIDLSRRIKRTSINTVESAVIPNTTEMNAIKTEGLGKYNSKEFMFVRRFPTARSDLTKTSVNAIAAFKTNIALHPGYTPLFFALRATHTIFDATVLKNIEAAQKGQKYFVMHEPAINQSFTDFKKQYFAAKEKEYNIIVVLDPAMLSLAELRRKAEFAAAQKPEYLIIQHRNPIEFAIAYMQIVKPFIELKTRIIDAGVWTRYVYQGKYRHHTKLPLTCMLYGVDSVCQGVAPRGGSDPAILILNNASWKYQSHNVAKKNVVVGAYDRKKIYSKGTPTYYASKVDAVIIADSRLRDIRSMNDEELISCINESAYLKERFGRFSAVWQEG